MLAPKVDKKKLLEYSAVLGIIFLIILYVVLTNFVFKAGTNAEGGPTMETNITGGVIKEVKKLDVQVVETEKFKELKENVLVETKIEDLNVGKKNPFSPKATIATTTATSTKKTIE